MAFAQLESELQIVFVNGFNARRPRLENQPQAFDRQRSRRAGQRQPEAAKIAVAQAMLPQDERIASRGRKRDVGLRGENRALIAAWATRDAPGGGVGLGVDRQRGVAVVVAPRGRGRGEGDFFGLLRLAGRRRRDRKIAEAT